MVHTCPFVKTFGSWAFGITWILVLRPKVYNFVQQSIASCGVNGRVESSFSSKLFWNNFGSLFGKRCIIVPLFVLQIRAFLMPNYHVVFFESCLWSIDWVTGVTQYGNFAEPLDNQYWTMCWMIYLFYFPFLIS